MPRESQDDTKLQVRKILVATDFSAASARARDYALVLAAPDATLTLIHAHLLPLPDWESERFPDWMPPEPGIREELLERLRLFGAPARAAGLSVKTVLQEGLPADVILTRAAILQPDLIVMGTHGRRSLERCLMGSTAERVVRLAPSPVLTVSAQALESPRRIRKVLCPLGLEAGFETLAFATGLADHCGSGLTVLHVLESTFGQAPGVWLERRARERLLEAVGATGRDVHAEALVRSGRPSREILQAALERAADVIVLGVHDRCQADRGFCGSTADQVVREANCAVITVPSAVERGSAEAWGALTASAGERV